MKRFNLTHLRTILAVLLVQCALVSTHQAKADTYYVTSSLDDATGGFEGPQGTLRWAINQANNNPGHDNIYFDINDGLEDAFGVYTITMAINFEQIGAGGSVTIDGYTQPGATVGNPLIRLIGSNNDVFQFVQDDVLGGRDGSGSTVRGFYMGPVASFSISILGADDILIEDCWIGLAPDGSAVNNTGQSKGITITGANCPACPDQYCRNITLKNCVFSSNALMGVDVWQGENVHIQNCYVGTDKAGAVSAGGYANTGAGIFLGNSRDCIIENCIIAGNDVPGTDPNQGSTGAINMYATSGTRVENNLLGISATGANITNGNYGVLLAGGANNGHGSASNNEFYNNTIANIVAGNHSPGYGVLIVDDAQNNVFEGNNIIDNASHGIYILTDNATNNIIGAPSGSSDGSKRNTITGNGGQGVLVADGDFNTIRVNSIYCNGTKAIDLDGGSGNEGLAAPTITSGDNIMPITGTGPANSTIDIYGTSTCAACPAQGDGLRWLGQTTSNGSGAWSYSGMTANTVASTATNSNGSTSEYSSCIAGDPLCFPPVAIAGNDFQLCGNDLVANKIALRANQLLQNETGSWTVESGLNSGAVNFTNQGSPLTDIDGLTSGDYIIRWTVSNNDPFLPPSELPCTSFDELTISVDPIPDPANAGDWETYCEGSVTDINISANNPTNGTGQWSWVSTPTGTITNVNNNATTASGFSTGYNTLRWTITSDLDICPAEVNDLVITIDAGLDAGPDIEICDPNITLPTLVQMDVACNCPDQNNNPAPIWRLVSSTATSDPFINGNASYHGAWIEGLNAGVHKWVWDAPSATQCPDTVTITIGGDAPTADAGTPQNICGTSTTLAANAPETGETALWTVTAQPGGSPNPTFGDATSNTSSISGLQAGTYTLQWEVSSGCGGSVSDEVDLVVSLPPKTADAGSDVTICETETHIMAANAASAGETGTWTGAPISGSNNESASVSGLSAGSHTFTWTLSTGPGCTDSESDIEITVDGEPSAAVAGSDDHICSDVDASLSATTPVVGSGLWTSSGNGTFGDDTQASTTYSPGTNETGTSTLTWTVSNGVCPDKTSTLDLEIDPAPTQAAAGNVDQICETGSSTLNANAPSAGETGSWTGQGINGSTNASETVSGLSPGSHTFTWTLSTGGVCADSQDDVEITVDAVPSTADAGTVDDICASADANLSAVAPTTGTGQWSTSGTGTIGDEDSRNTSYTAGAGESGQVTMTWTVSNGLCPSSTSDVSFNVDAEPDVSDAGPSQTLCIDDAITLAANVPVVGSGSWSLVSGQGTFDQGINASSSVSSANVGTNTYMWTISNGLCAPSTSTVDITLDQIPDEANLGPDLNICLADPFSLPGNNPSVGSGAWTSGPGTTGGTIDQTSVFNSTVSSFVDGDILEAIWTISNGACPSSDDTVTINAAGITAPSVILNADQNLICEGDDVVFTATGINGGTGATYAFFDGQNSSLQAASSSNTLTLTGLTQDTSVYVTLTSNSSCLGSNDPNVNSTTIDIQVDRNPSTPLAGNDQTLCTDTAQLFGSTPSVGTGIWTLVSGTGIIEIATDPDTRIFNIPENSSATFQWETSNGVCPSLTDEIEITRVGNLTSPDAGSDLTICETETAQLSANSVGAGETGEWRTSGNGTFSSDFNSQAIYTPGSDDLSALTVDLTWAINNGTCPEAISTMTVSIDQTPSDPLAGDDQMLCVSLATLEANSPAIGTGAWSVVSGGALITDPNDPASTLTGIGANETIELDWIISNGQCPSKTDQVSIIRTGDLTTPTAGDDQDICQTELHQLEGNAVQAGETGEWRTTGDGNFSSNSDPVGTYSAGGADITAGTVTLIWAVNNGTCPEATDQMILTVDQSPTTASAGVDQEVCDGPVTLAANAANIGTGIWTVVSGTGTVENELMATSELINIATPQIITLDWTISNGACPSSSDQVVITTTGNIEPEVTINANSNPICEGDITNAGLTTVGGGDNPTYSWYINDVFVENGANLSDVELVNGDEIKVEMTSSLECAFPILAVNSQIISVIAPPSPEVTTQDLQFCQGSTVTLQSIVGNGNLQWVDSASGSIIVGETESSFPVGYSGTFYIQEDNGICPPVASNTVTVDVRTRPVVDAGEDITMYFDEEVQLDGSVSVGDVSWGPQEYLDDPTIENPFFTPDQSLAGYNTYTLYGENGMCKDSDQVLIWVRTPIIVPNVYTPNGDGLNEVLTITGVEGYPFASMNVYNRWGNLVYEEAAVNFWDGTTNSGKLLPTGTYYWVLNLRTPDPTEDLAGFVELMR